MKNNVRLNSYKALTVNLLCITLLCSFYSATKAESESLNYVCKAVDCDNKKGDEQAAKDEQAASYALGVRFHRTIGGKYSDLDYVLFLKGATDASRNDVTLNEKTLNDNLEDVIISEKDKSKMFLRDLIDSTEYDVLEIDGVYVEKQPELPEDWDDKPLCERRTESDSFSKYRVRYARLVLDHSSKTLWPGVSNGKNRVQNGRSAASLNVVGCLDLHEREMIRGWRTVLNEMSPGDKWAVAIPPALAYGNRGVKDFVKKDVALYFILELKNKPQSYFQKMRMQ